ncbi:hypothetical protein A2130_00820 [Candidatus Woesebacteria bacterium GWC2_33_12]|uniref:Uncharacterized protein n=1 Tax=Candidatus Woesebacteria bacterium GW2011_GWB1_33_22 TaxID=1618566 RepID=A0A0G0CPG8_9BACT|nr:MAG: hypothetical protein UR29_C0002G0057 [Candidatus Woesebacteria bacterium GW2011_GWC2_33_12]KKP42529.1 MAG: hypothetical protein UR33_C0002G0105 [Candidatus Woesebacteria bacterium GW2011_GWA2_33_20]KKP45272.1 MAG: hypothetical protein UR35_C0002G0105 [Candidatus Woesebacteria bacterium GW2011_GWB1_33_22]KKP47100.1 MAG: hypothetical protein UR37_C0002G0012 [Microgenomates group bacterium GW2011_GWC1_33_28]KKP50942.1 MAG: hypothetical protein UR41_C0002G0106 [Candidatus Woesebacteria bact
MVIANILGFFLFFYLYWKKLKDDYSSEKIFNSGFVLVLGILLGTLFSKYLFVAYWFWITLLTIAIAQLIVIFRFKLKLFESLDALIVSILPWLSLFYLTDSIMRSNLSSFLIFWVSLTSIFIFFLFDNFYRTFTWYKSGRVGFSGLATLGIFFIIKLFFSAQKFEYLFSGTIAFISFLLLFKLSKRDG